MDVGNQSVGKTIVSSSHFKNIFLSDYKPIDVTKLKQTMGNDVSRNYL